MKPTVTVAEIRTQHSSNNEVCHQNEILRNCAY